MEFALDVVIDQVERAAALRKRIEERAENECRSQIVEECGHSEVYAPRCDDTSARLDVRAPRPSIGVMSVSVESHSIVAVHAWHVADFARRWGIEPKEVLEPFGLEKEGLLVPSARLPMSTFLAVVARARDLTRDPAMGVAMGLKMQVSVHGFLGLAAMTCANIGEAIDLALRFLPLRTDAGGARLVVSSGVASLYVTSRVPLGDVESVLGEAILTGMWKLGERLTGRALIGGADVPWPEPPHHAYLRDALPGTIRFGQPALRLYFDASYLDLPLRTADQVSLRLVVAQCERELDELNQASGLRGRLRSLLSDANGRIRSLDELADAVHMSSRTLKRKLAAEGTSYSRLVDGSRLEKATELLTTTDLSVENVADRLGYSDAANFAKAFRRWSGLAPAEFRRTRVERKP